MSEPKLVKKSFANTRSPLSEARKALEDMDVLLVIRRGEDGYKAATQFDPDRLRRLRDADTKAWLAPSRLHGLIERVSVYVGRTRRLAFPSGSAEHKKVQAEAARYRGQLHRWGEIEKRICERHQASLESVALSEGVGAITMEDIPAEEPGTLRARMRVLRDAIHAQTPSESAQAVMQSKTSPTLPSRTVSTNKSTSPRDAEAKLIAALTHHHRYANEGCLNQEPIGNNQLARLAKVSPSTASAFFQKQFKGYAKYRAACSHPAGLLPALKLLNQDYTPHLLYGGEPSTQEGDKE